jgi:hypothetical protein
LRRLEKQKETPVRVGTIIVAGAILASGCAQSPESVQPAYASEVPYMSWTCDQLGQEGMNLSTALAQASKQQEDARTGDTVGVIFLGLPVSSTSGSNVAPEIARLQGEINAVRHVGIKKNCATATLPPEPVTEAEEQATNRGPTPAHQPVSPPPTN